jgi:hypothetical protein
VLQDVPLEDVLFCAIGFSGEEFEGNKFTGIAVGPGWCMLVMGRVFNEIDTLVN